MGKLHGMSELIARHAIERVLHLLGTFPVVAITGARQVGKSTLAGQIVEKLGGVYKTLDHEFTRADALDDPQGFVTQTDSLLVIDEIQQAPAEIRQTVINNGGGHLNHSLFWRMMGPGKGGPARGPIAEEINRAFGTFDAFKQQFTQAATTRFGSGWAWLVLDAGTGIRNLGRDLPPNLKRVDILLTHLHMDHLQGLPFFAPLRNPEIETHIWGPASTMLSLRARLQRYVSPPLFPVSVRDLSPTLHFHELSVDMFEIGEFRIVSQLVIHPNPTVGYRITRNDKTATYLPDHEPMLGALTFPRSPEWTSGYALAEGADLLIHDTQYTREEYQARVGFGHSSIDRKSVV